MRLRRLHPVVYGALTADPFELGPGVVVIFGHNETGKSSFRSALETLLYGFDPGTRDAHPLHQWDGGARGDLELRADLELDDGTPLSVERVLQSSGKLRTGLPGQPFAGPRRGNGALELTGGLPREVYRAIYSLDTDQLEALGGRVRGHVDELLLPRIEALELLPVAELRRALRAAHLELWRSDRRGKPRARELGAALAKARAAERGAAAEERELRKAREERERLTLELERLAEHKRVLERERDDAPYRRALAELERRRRALVPELDLSGLGELPLVDPAVLESEIAEGTEALSRPTGRLALPELVLTEGAALVLGAASEVEAMLEAAPTLAAERALQRDLEQRAETGRSRAVSELAVALDDPPEVRRVRRLPIEALRAAQQGWARAWDAHTAHRAAPRSPVWLAVLGGIGVLLGAAVPLTPLPSVLGLVGAGLALAALLAAWVVHVRARSEPPPARPGDVERILEGMRVPDDRLRSPAELGRLVDALARAQTRLEESADAAARADALARGLEERARELRTQCDWLGLTEDAREEGEVELASLLRSALAEARELQARVERDRAERAQALREIESHRPVLERKRAHLARLERVLRANAPQSADVAAAYREVRERGAGERFVRERERELRLDPRFERLGDPFRGDRSGEESAGEEEPDGERSDADREAELAALEERIGHARERLGELGSRLGADPGSRQARARDAVDALETELAELERERDRLALLESIVGAAEREFRDAHQTDVLRRASAYLTAVTGGRYSRLDVDEGADGELLVTCADREEPAPVGPPLSRGTLDQIYLCLRVGLLDHLDQARERLPLILDDALVRCDRSRRAEIYRLLADVSRGRQVFLLTCHDHFADEACRELAGDQQELFATASRIDLGQ